MSPLDMHRIPDTYLPTDVYPEEVLLAQCIASGQVEPDQVEAHYREGDLGEGESTKGMAISPAFWWGGVLSMALWSAAYLILKAVLS